MREIKTIGLLLIFFSTYFILAITAKHSHQNVVIDSISDLKEFKKLLRTKTNVLIMFIIKSKNSDTQFSIKVFQESAEIIKGLGTMVLIDCNSNNDKKKLCKKLKIPISSESLDNYLLKHYKNGEFHKNYDRQMITQSLVNFMRDPTGDLPWNEDLKGADVNHISDMTQFGKLLKKSEQTSKSMMVMFYAPWCGFCKQLKPEYNQVATELKGKSIIAAIDCDRPENSIARKQYNITGFPTLLYFENGKFKFTYEGDNKKDALINFMHNPNASPVSKKAAKDEDWSADPNSQVVHLTENGFEPALKDEKSVLVMFYAPWCGHCKRMKPEYEKAAQEMKSLKIPGILAALDATKESAIGQKYGVKGYPTVKYFVNAEYKFDINIRESDKIINFMKDPKEPPPPPEPENPWEEEQSEVEHLNDDTFKTFLKKKKHALVMFYAPWCGHCKKTKPEFISAAEAFKDDPRVSLAAVDCTRYPGICSAHDVKGYPTFKYFSYLKRKMDYNGGRTEGDFVKYLSNPVEETSYQHQENFGTFPGADKILMLNDNNFEKISKPIKRLLVLFYAPWCGHCKAIKPDYASAAAKTLGDSVRLGAIDCDANSKIPDKYKIYGYPTILLFENGKYTSTYEGPRRAFDLLNYAKGNEKVEL